MTPCRQGKGRGDVGGMGRFAGTALDKCGKHEIDEQSHNIEDDDQFEEFGQEGLDGHYAPQTRM